MSALYEGPGFFGKSRESRMRLHIYICEYVRILQLPDSSEGVRAKVTLQPAVLEHVLEHTSHVRGHVMACAPSWFLYFLLIRVPGVLGHRTSDVETKTLETKI